MKLTIIIILLFLQGCSKPVKFVDETIGGAILVVINPLAKGVSNMHDYLLGEKERKHTEVSLPKKESYSVKPKKYSKLRILIDMAELNESIRLHARLLLGEASEKYGGKEGITKYKKEVKIFMKQNCKKFALEKKREYTHLNIYNHTLSNCNYLTAEDLKMF